MSGLPALDGSPEVVAVLLPLAALLPMLAAAAVARPAWRARLPTLAIVCAIPALIVAFLVPVGAESRMPWLLLDLRLRLDETGVVFLRFTSLVWLAAGLYARGYLRTDPAAPRFFAFYLLSMGGNFGLLLAADLVGFYLFFAALGLACYGLVLHAEERAARRASRIYLTFVLVGDGLLFAALVLLARASGDLSIPLASAAEPLATALLLAGLGIKLGAWPLHSWLPIAHPVAPIPASAVLSGVVIKSGLFGWLRFLPFGSLAVAGWSGPIVALGLLAVFYAAAAGTVQRDPKTVLAYSSVSQVGLMTVAVGIGLAGPAAWPAARVALLGYAVHHAITKGALFLGVGLVAGERDGRRRALAVGALAVAAASLAGFPLTSGAEAKALLKTAVGAGAVAPGGGIALALSLGAAATAVLMGRMLWLSASARRSPAGYPAPDGRGSAPDLWSWGSWLGLLAAMLTARFWLLPAPLAEGAEPPHLWGALWPALLGAGIAGLLWRVGWRGGSDEGAGDGTGPGAGRPTGGRARPGAVPPGPAIPPGDLLVPLARLSARLGDVARRATRSARTWAATHAAESRLLHPKRLGRIVGSRWIRVDGYIRSWTGAGTLLVLALLLFLLVWRVSAG